MVGALTVVDGCGVNVDAVGSLGGCPGERTIRTAPTITVVITAAAITTIQTRRGSAGWRVRTRLAMPSTSVGGAISSKRRRSRSMELSRIVIYPQ